MNRTLYLLLLTLTLAACQTVPEVDKAGTSAATRAASATSGEPSSPEPVSLNPGSEDHESGMEFSETPSSGLEASDYSSADLTVDDLEAHLKTHLKGGEIEVNFKDLAIPVFINEVFGNLLSLSFEIDASISERPDLVTLRAEETKTGYELFGIALQVLQNYGIGVEYQGDVLRFVLSKNATSGEPPLLISGRTLPEVPASHRPIIQIVPIRSVNNTNVAIWLKRTFQGMNLRVTEDIERNALVLQGPARIIRQAINAIELLDKPNMRGRYSVRITPAILDAETLANQLIDMLRAQGYGASRNPITGAIVILPIRQTNSVVVFAGDQDVLEHVKTWAIDLDKPGKASASSGLFYYQVRNTSAEDLAEVLNEVNINKAVEGTAASGVTSGGNVIVDRNRNGLIFTGDSKNWEGLLPIISAMDRPARLVLIQVLIASVTLTNDTDVGIEWLFKGRAGDYGQVGRQDLSLGGTGFTYTLNNSGQVRFALNALAQDQRVSILSEPRILVKSGESAQIDVGEEVPVITSQAQSIDALNAPVLQSIQYRRTGVLLRVEPIVHSGNRVDLNLSQVVSEALAAGSGVNSPTIFNRSVQTSLTLSDGGAVVIGGLVSNSENEGDTRIPILGSIPGLGALFRSSGKQNTRSELILMIQAYIVDEDETDDFNQRMRDDLDLLDPDDLY